MLTTLYSFLSSIYCSLVYPMCNYLTNVFPPMRAENRLMLLTSESLVLNVVPSTQPGPNIDMLGECYSGELIPELFSSKKYYSCDFLRLQHLVRKYFFVSNLYLATEFRTRFKLLLLVVWVCSRQEGYYT